MNKCIQEKLEDFLEDGEITSKDLLHRISLLDMENVQFKHENREKLLECETRYQAILDTVDTHISLIGRDMKILWANKKATKVFGPDMAGKHCCEAY
jgi:PAS domain-containing protein